MNLTEHQETILTSLLQRGLAFKDSTASGRQMSQHRSGGETNLTKDRISLSSEDGQGLMDLGLLSYTASGTTGWSLTPEGSRLAVKLLGAGYTPISLPDLLEDTLQMAYFTEKQDDGEVAIPFVRKLGDARLVLVLGENAGGKSFFRRLVCLMASGPRWDSLKRQMTKPGPYPVKRVIHLSMEGRGHHMGSLVYGSEARHSTGQNSANQILGGIRNVEGCGGSSIMYWDEPDLGMSEGSAAGAGLEISDWMGDLHPLVQAVFITSHSKELVRQLAHLNPHYLYLGSEDGPQSLQEWLDAPVIPSRPAEVQQKSRARFKRIQHILNSKD
jgi:hypothetical protein